MRFIGGGGMMTVREMKEKKIELGLTNKMLSEASGIPLSTIDKLFGGATKAPRKLTLEAIERALLCEEESRRLTKQFLPQDKSTGCSEFGEESGKTRYTYSFSGTGKVSEAAASFGAKKRKYSIDDYYALPDDQRMELIDGELYAMAAPQWLHQRILGELFAQFRECIDRHANNCSVIFAPFDVRLDRDNYTMVQPDLLVICGKISELTAIRLEGPPDLAVEILSQSTRSKDMILKLYKYKNAGVREYWIVDPKYKTVTVHLLQDEDYHPVIYPFNAVIPVGISEGKCSIDFSGISERIEKDRAIFQRDPGASDSR